MVQHVTCKECGAYSCGLFSCLTPPQLTRLVRSRVLHSYAKGQPLFYEGNPAFAVYCVLQGTVMTWRTGHNGDQHIIRTRARGDVVGARAVLAGANYQVTAEPIEPLTACTIPREVFVGLVHDNQELAHRLLKKLALETIETEEVLMARTMDHVRQRTARLLLQLTEKVGAERSGVPVLRLPWRREAMASLVGTTPETLSRTLRAFVTQRILEVERQQVRVLDLGSLQRAAH